MRSNKYLSRICLDIYQRMYSEAEPHADFNQLMENGITLKPNWFMRYYLPMERQLEIAEEYLKKYKCSRMEKKVINETIWTGCSPNSCRETWREYIEES